VPASPVTPPPGARVRIRKPPHISLRRPPATPRDQPPVRGADPPLWNRPQRQDDHRRIRNPPATQLTIAPPRPFLNAPPVGHIPRLPVAVPGPVLYRFAPLHHRHLHHRHIAIPPLLSPSVSISWLPPAARRRPPPDFLPWARPPELTHVHGGGGWSSPRQAHNASGEWAERPAYPFNGGRDRRRDRNRHADVPRASPDVANAAHLSRAVPHPQRFAHHVAAPCGRRA